MKLPEERPLPNPQLMLQTVLDTPADPVRRRAPALVPVAAALAGAVIGGGVVFGVVGQDDAQPGGPVATPAPVTTSPAPPRSGGSTLAPGTTASFEHFTVTLSNFRQEGDDFTYQLKVCVVKIPQVPGTEDGRVRMGLESWSARTTGWRTPVSQTVRVGPTTFPVDTKFGVGQCGEGLVAAKVVDTTSKVTELEYENSLDEKAVWKVA
ncbi:hypothetical protein [Mariniluteicoccus flavus]